MAPLYPILNKRIPRRYLYIGGMISMIVAYVLLVLFYIPGTLIQMTAILSLTDSIEYGQLKNGKRNEAVTLSVRPMLDKIGGALSNGITGFIAVAAGMTGRLGLKVPKLKGEVFESAVIERHRRREESVDPPLSRQVPAR